MAAAQEEPGLKYTDLDPTTLEFKTTLSLYVDDLFKKSSGGIDNLSISCNFSAILYIAFCFIWDSCNPGYQDQASGTKRLRLGLRPGRFNIDMLIKKMAQLITFQAASVTIHSDTIMHKMIILTQELEPRSFVEISRRPQSTIDYVLDIYQRDYNSGIFCLVSGNDIIAHYFVIRRKTTTAGDDLSQKYSIISAHGCEYAQIKQYETVLDLEELYVFIDELKKPAPDPILLASFYKKYFLSQQHTVKGALKAPEDDRCDKTATGVYKNEDCDDDKTLDNMFSSTDRVKMVTYLAITGRIKTLLEGGNFNGGRPQTRSKMRVNKKTKRKRTRCKRKRTRCKRTRI